MALLNIICCVILFVSLHAVLSKGPVVIVPGTGGSQIEAKLQGKPQKHWYCYSHTDDYFTLWLSITSLSNKYSLTCWADNMELDWDMSTMTVRNKQGVITRVSGFGDTSTIETLDTTGLVKYTKPMIDYLVNLGYQKGKSLRAAPYDFRYSPEHLPDNYHQRLKTLIEETYNINGNKKVNLISHSYGCTVTLYFLSLQTQEWKNKYLKQWISLSGVFGGTMEEVQVYVSGYLEGIPNFLINRKLVRAEQRSSTSNLFMLPNYEIWPQDYVIVKTTKRSYKLSEIDDLLKDIGYPQGAVMRHHIVNTTYLMQTSPGVPIHCLYGNIKDSISKTLVYDEKFENPPSQIVKGDGDGTVNVESLSLCRRFSVSQNQPVDVSVFQGVNHNGVFSHKKVLAKVASLL